MGEGVMGVVGATGVAGVEGIEGIDGNDGIIGALLWETVVPSRERNKPVLWPKRGRAGGKGVFLLISSDVVCTDDERDIKSLNDGSVILVFDTISLDIS